MQALRNHQSFGAAFSSNKPVHRNNVCCKAVSPGASRREAVAALTVFTGLVGWAKQAQAVCADLDTAEAGDECRRAELANDEGKNYKGSYKSLSSGPAKRTAGNVPVSELGQQYVKDTRELADTIETYITIDVYDKKRQGLIKQLKTDAVSWVSKYARGGSVRAQSARQIYIAADAVLGHLASNGLAPLPNNKAKTVREVISTGLAFLDEGR